MEPINSKMMWITLITLIAFSESYSISREENTRPAKFNPSLIPNDQGNLFLIISKGCAYFH